ncbi:MAG: ROK family protein [Marmoricola sp.]
MVSPTRSADRVASAGELLALVREGRAGTRSELSRLTGMSRTAVVNRVGALLDAGLLRQVEEHEATGGRPAARLAFAPEAGAVLAVAIGRSRAQVAVTDLAGQERGTRSFRLAEQAAPDAVLSEVVDGLRELMPSAGAPVFGIGVGLPGVVDPVHGSSLGSPVMRSWRGVPLRPAFAALGEYIPLFLGNDAHLLALSERLGHATSFDDMIVVKASTGLGLGIVSAGQVLHGRLGAAGDIGHTKVAAASELLCRCGDTGCVETLAAGWALVAELAGAGRPIEHVRDVVRLAQDGDAAARALLRRSGRVVGELLAVAVDLLNPQAIVLGGDMAAAFDVYADGVRESIFRGASPLAARELQIVPATYGERAGLVGCAALALEHVLAPAAIDRRLSPGG